MRTQEKQPKPGLWRTFVGAMALMGALSSCEQVAQITDRTAPVIAGVESASGPIYAGQPVTLKVNATDNTGVNRYTLTLNGQTVCVSAQPLCTVRVPESSTGRVSLVVTVQDAAGNATSLTHELVYQTAAPLPGGLQFSEIGNGWLELHNPTTSPQPLGAYKLRSEAVTLMDMWTPIYEFPLPAVTVAAGGYVFVRRPQTFEGQYRIPPATSGWIEPADEEFSLYPTTSTGHVELLRDGQTVDFVRWGANTRQPTTAGTWAMNVPGTTYDRVLGRVAGQWTSLPFATPGGVNDVPATAADLDKDGIPDTAEVPGGRYAGLDLYALGVRTGQKDILVEVDTMASADPSVNPGAATFQKVVSTFAQRGFVLHVDRGAQFAAALDPAQFNLGNELNTVPFTPTFSISPQANTASNLDDLKSQYFDPRRLPLFHYAILGSDDPDGWAGRGELFGNDFVTTTQGQALESLATTFMHELGHNLGLSHGGDDALNHKPNYFSIMNYRYHCLTLEKSDPSCPMDYSDGSSSDMDENHLDETAGIGRGPRTMDWNGDKVTQTDLQFDVNKDGVYSVLKDHNDWANLKLAFAQTKMITWLSTGTSVPTNIIGNDHQKALP